MRRPRMVRLDAPVRPASPYEVDVDRWLAESRIERSTIPYRPPQAFSFRKPCGLTPYEVSHVAFSLTSSIRTCTLPRGRITM